MLPKLKIKFVIRLFTIIIPPGLLNFGIFGALKSGIVVLGNGIMIGILGKDGSGELVSGRFKSGRFISGITTSVRLGN